MELDILHQINRLEQVITEDKYDRKQVRKHIREHIPSEDPIVKQLLRQVENFCMHSAVGYDPQELTTELMLTTLIVDKGPIQSIVANLTINMEVEESYLNAVETFTKLILSAHGIIYDIQLTSNDAYIIIPKFKLPAHLQEYISCKRYLPPLSTLPRRWHSNVGGGYLTRKESVILGQLNHHEGYQALDAINILQEIPLELDVIALEYEETPNKPLDTVEKQKQFQQLTDESLSVYQETLDRGNEFYFTWKFDKRGRMYSSGYHINIQSTKYKKSIINFKRKELIV